MKLLLADESVDFRLVKALRDNAYEIDAVIESHAGIPDEDVLKLAIELDAILLTEDKDFGELTYRLRKSSKGIILLRLSGKPIDYKVDKIEEVLEKYQDKLYLHFTIISTNKVRIREMQNPQNT